jgi:hypothetical protein
MFVKVIASIMVPIIAKARILKVLGTKDLSMKSAKKTVLAVLMAITMFGVFSAVVLAAATPPACPPCQAPSGAKDAKGAKPAIPDVTLPFTFKCAHCGMPITIKKTADWTKGCFGCACGLKNIDCYNDSLKKPAK